MVLEVLYQSPFPVPGFGLIGLQAIVLDYLESLIVRAFILFPLLALAMIGCQSSEPEPEPMLESKSEPAAFNARITEHRDGDDLATAGLGLAGLTAGAPPLADAAAPTSTELRRLAIQSAWASLAALNPAGGMGGLFEDLPHVPGLEFAAFRVLPDRKHPARVLVQLPDAFDPQNPCLVLAPASGSRGVYGAVPLVSVGALARGCAVAYTDKGAGTDFFDYSNGTGVQLDGIRGQPADGPLGFLPEQQADNSVSTVAMPHAHSGDHPEADWGEHVLDAARFGLEVLNHAVEGEFSAVNTRIIATGLSNGAGAVLRAAEQDHEGLIDAVVAVMPNITAPGVPHLFDIARVAALYQPCMLGDLESTMDMPLGNPLLAAAGQQRCAALTATGLLEEAEPELARQRLLDAGFEESALALAPLNVALDLWRSVLVAYSSAYLRTGAFDMPCGYAMAAPDASPAQRQAWWATHSGVGAGGGIVMLDGLANGRDTALPGLQCLNGLQDGDGEEAARLREAIEATRASAALPEIPVLIVHGRDDGLVPVTFSSRPYVEQARANGARIAYWEVANSQHFDAVLAAPGVGDRLVPILPYGWHGLSLINEVLDGQAELGPDRQIETTPAPEGQPLEWDNLGLMR